MPLGDYGRLIRFVRGRRDVDGDHRDELVVARAANHLVVLSWQEAVEARGGEEDFEALEPRARLVNLWETTFGGRTSPSLSTPSAATSLRRSRDLIAANGPSLRRGVRRPRTGAHGGGMARVFGRMVGAFDLDDDGIAEIVEATRSGFGPLERFLPGESKRKLGARVHPVYALARDPGSERLVVGGPWGFVFKEVDAHYVNVVTRGVAYETIRPTLFIDGMAYLSAADWESF